MRKGRRVAVAEATDRLLVNKDWDTEACPLDRHTLDCIHQLRALAWTQAGRGTDACDLAHTVRHLRGREIGIERIIAHERRAPQAAKLRDLLVEAHLPKQILDPVVERP